MAAHADTDRHVLQTRDGLKYLAPDREAAWLGLLSAHTALTRALDTELAARHGLGLSAYEVLSRLARAEDGYIRMTHLAAMVNLSVSRVSRVIDQLAERGLVERGACPGDSRVVHVKLRPAGSAVVKEAQDTFFGVIEDRFLNRLDCTDIERLAAIFSRVSDAQEAECKASAAVADTP